MDRTFVTPGPDGLRALSHPGRLRMLGMLRADGPATATTLATRLGLNSGATSYHLRQLEKHGFVVEDAERGNGRDRWWRAAHQSTRTGSAELTTPEEHDTYDAYLLAVSMLYHERQLRSLEERQLLPEAWREASDLSDWALRLTAARAEELLEAIHAVIDGFAEDAEDDPAAAPFVVNVNGFVRPGSVGPEASA
ncbi:MAG: putative transcriptional regulator [Nocardioidaceae bacterium]|nr:putative transcriptional regulator [Nocardioidaceae bacterium]